jgi:hypothetical protein
MEKTVLQELAELTTMPFSGLKDRWRALFGTEPPGYKREHMIRRLAYRIQELAYGGLPAQTKAELERIAEEDERQRRQARAGKRKPKGTQPLAGTRLIRVWNGKRHVVTAVEGGFEYGGRRYKSLSAIAKAITGAHWSGPQFFGLRTPRKDGSQ